MDLENENCENLKFENKVIPEDSESEEDHANEEAHVDISQGLNEEDCQEQSNQQQIENSPFNSCIN